MKKLFLIITLVLFATMAFAETASWTAPASGGIVDGYRLRYSIIGDEAVEMLPVGADKTSVEVTGLKQGTRYRFWVTAYNSAGEGDAVTKYYATPEIIIVPGAPTDLSISITIKIN